MGTGVGGGRVTGRHQFRAYCGRADALRNSDLLAARADLKLANLAVLDQPDWRA